MDSRSSQLPQAAIIFVLAALSLILFLSIAKVSSTSAFTVGGRNNPSINDIGAVLDQLAPAGSVLPGAQGEIETLSLSGGRDLKISLAEGTFEAETIRPETTWKKILANPSIVVSSADERLRNNGGISKLIGNGCGISESKNHISTGTAHIEDCIGPYSRKFQNFKYVANAIVVAWTAVAGVPNCKSDADTVVQHTASEYTKCIQNAIHGSLLDLFNKPAMSDINTLVVPALGTGVGALPVGLFYQSAADALIKCLTLIKGCERRLPRNIVFMVWHGQTNWQETKQAIVTHLMRLGEAWRPNYMISDRLKIKSQYLGVLLVMLCFAILMNFSVSVPARKILRLSPTDNSELWIIFVGWGVIAVGTLSLFSSSFGVFIDEIGDGWPTVGWNTLLGACSAVCCGVTKFVGNAYLDKWK
ncbi:MAG: hypothetical protein Q7T81_17550 [Pseudolabrys sp.]|nr:hypothetical protein [Pseudolabrys sp.]